MRRLAKRDSESSSQEHLRSVKREKATRTRVESVSITEENKENELTMENPTLKRHGRSRRVDTDDSEQQQEEQLRAVKREKVSRSRVESEPVQVDEENEMTQEDDTTDDRRARRRQIRSRYLKVINEISEKRDDLGNVDSDNFSKIISEVEDLHKNVNNPREQVADAEALWDITKTLVTSVKSHSNEGITPGEFVSSLFAQFGDSSNRSRSTEDNVQVTLNWKNIGLAVSPVFRKCQGCCTMLGPMNPEFKQRKVAKRRATKPADKARTEEVDDTGGEEKTDTDKNMATMFGILRKKKQARLECLTLNRESFPQTVENLFALSFLAKDGRVEITIDKDGFHYVSPRNAPSADSVRSREVKYTHFVFRFDFKDWKLMINEVPKGHELMPHREATDSLSSSQNEKQPEASNSQFPTTPIRKLSRNRGLVVQEESVVEDSPESIRTANHIDLRRAKRKLI
ncbi:hypothetical protein ACFE04_028758 [Oxalis oulophora]